MSSNNLFEISMSGTSNQLLLSKLKIMVYVFKTSVKTKEDIQELKPHLNNLFEQIQWNFDLEDCDKIFRVVSTKYIAKEIISFFKSKGFNCEELED